MRRFLTLVFAIIPFFAAAQDRANTILVLDGSGSMWGQIDGVNKIVIARDVVGTLLDDIPTDQNLGLTVYGHRERGNCADIETVVAPGADTRAAIRAAVNGINPRGKTPMTDAVIAAAEALRYTEEKATVILVSDGIETCHPDPCAAARVLEETGVDFTAHVVGFDVTDPLALEQMQCLADNTGGTFLTATDADELASALETVAVATEPAREPVPAPKPEPVVATVTFEARIGSQTGVLIDTPVFWDIVADSAGAIMSNTQGNPISVDLQQGSYDVTGYWAAQEVEQARQFVSASNPRTIVLVFEEPALKATVTAPSQAAIGSTIEVSWNGPDLPNDYLGISPVGENGWDNYAYTRDGETVNLLMPVEPGTYEIQYFLAEGREPIGGTTIELTDIPFGIIAPETAQIGEAVEIGWTGPGYENDYIGIGPVGAASWENYTYTRDGNPLMLTMLTEPGDYEISYFLSQGRTQKATARITLTEVQSSLIAPDTATAGEMVEIAWVGPGYQNDYIGIGPKGAGSWDNYTYTREGSPLMLQMPVEPGEYDISYFLSQDRSILVTRPITVTAVEASITAPAVATAGELVELAWAGPDYEGDYIGIGPRGEGRWDNYTYTRDGSPLMLRMPVEPGEYDISYFLSQDRTALVTRPITVEAVGASLTAPQQAIAGATIEIGWTGPNYDGDYIGVGPKGAGRWDNYTYTRDGAPLKLQMPVTAGEYDITYFLSQDRSALTTVTITLTEPAYGIVAPDTALEGDTIEVAWTGPGYEGDYLGVGPLGAGRWDTYTYTRDGNPLRLRIPPTAGDYEISYFLGQDRHQAVTVPIKVMPVEVTLVAPASAKAGGEIEVAWTGPDYDGDYIGIGPRGEGRWDTYAYTRTGDVLTIRVPDQPGDYDISYFISQGRTQKAVIPLTVE